MIRSDINGVEISGSPIQLGIELTTILIGLKNSDLPIQCFASAIRTFLMNYEPKDRIRFLSMLKCYQNQINRKEKI